MNNSTKILLALAAGWLTATVSAQDRIHYTGTEISNPTYHDGQLSPVVGVHNIQLVRANREHPDASNGNGWTYNHQPMLAYWNGQFYYQYLADPSDEHVPPSQTFLMTSKDGYQWTNPEIVFPPYKVPDGYTAYYTTDKSEPTTSSTKYTGPVEMPEGETIFKAVLVNAKGRVSGITTRNYVLN